MRVIVSYVVVTQGTKTEEFVSRFVSTYLAYPAGAPHEVICACNGGPLNAELGSMLHLIRAKFYPRKNDPGFDIGAHCELARNFDCDALFACGESVYFWRANWLARSLDVWNRHGPGFYGFMASNNVTPHLNTTCFLCDPKLLKSVPVMRTREDRHAFEHGSSPFWKRVQALGKPVRLITWNGDYGPGEWRATRAGLWQSDQSDLIVKCIHSDRFDEADEATKLRWRTNADSGVRH